MIAFNYAFDEEADVFLEMVTTIVTARNKKRLVKQQRNLFFNPFKNVLK